jgi:hypothetical protein
LRHFTQKQEGKNTGCNYSGYRFGKWTDTHYQQRERFRSYTGFAVDELVSFVKAADALHVACAIVGNCGYFITVDKRLLKYHDERIIVCNPIEFFNIISG